MKLIPLVVLIQEDDLQRLQPVVSELAEKLAPHCDGFAWRLNGWTPEMLAWSRVLQATAAEDLEIVTAAEALQDARRATTQGGGGE